ncbi:MAG: hypothetical protein HGA80_05900, partial [Candidatus Omnitrophica bacterium]|nr:hypothetical protein [Candidatus Omnitrophota bacterium]
RDLKEKPAQCELLKAAYEKKKARLSQLESKALELERARKALELDLKSKEQSIVTANAQLMTLRTNKEYQTKLFEIENMKADKSVLEEDILRSMESSEKVAQEIAQEKQFLAEEEKKYLAEKEKVDVVIAALQDKASALESRRREALIGIDKKILEIYDRVVENRGGIALVPVSGNSCGGCFMHMPPQVINKIKMYSEIVRCEMCTRFLYLQDEL